MVTADNCEQKLALVFGISESEPPAVAWMMETLCRQLVAQTMGYASFVGFKGSQGKFAGSYGARGREVSTKAIKCGICGVLTAQET